VVAGKPSPPPTYHLARINQAMRTLRSPARGSGASRVPWGEPVMARESAITLLAYAFYRVSMSGILSHRREEAPARVSSAPGPRE
jgi:hypothetical protein